MAAVLESLSVPRAFAAGRAAPFSAPAPAAAASVLGFRRSGVLQERKGLRIDTRFRRLALASSSAAASRSGFARLGVVCEAKEAAVEAVPGVTDSTWQSLVIDCELPTLVEFWAPWCGPCRMIHPVIDELAQLYAGKLKCYKVNTDECPSIATQYGIRSIPTVIIFKNGEKKDAIIGAVPKSTLISSIEKFL